MQISGPQSINKAGLSGWPPGTRTPRKLLNDSETSGFPALTEKLHRGHPHGPPTLLIPRPVGRQVLSALSAQDPHLGPFVSVLRAPTALGSW